MSLNTDATEDYTNTLPDITSATQLTGWTKDEKIMLLASLKEHGSHKVDEIHSDIPTKTETEITAAIDYYKNKAIAAKASITPQCPKRIRRTRIRPRIPLTQWVKYLTDSLSYSVLQTETVNALRLIAKFEDMPPSHQTEQIDFKKVYHHLADAMEGKSLTDNRLVIEVINNCLMDVIIMSRSFIKPSSFRFLINSLNLKEEKSLKGFHPSKDCELACLQHLCNQRNYNPFNIPEDYLVPCTNVSVEKA